MVDRDVLTTFLDELLAPPPGLRDKSNNGLQVEGDRTVEKVVFGVDACLSLFEEARSLSAEYIFVHHGLSWGDGFRRLIGLTAARVRVLFRHGISLYASHLPLDLHPEVGHNAVIARRLGLTDLERFFDYGGVPIGWRGAFTESRPLAGLVQAVGEALRTEVQVFGDVEQPVRRIGVVSGGGAGAVEEAARTGVEVLITGEMDHEHIHIVRELGIAVLAAGHYRTECPGVEAVMERVAGALDVECRFIDLPTGR